MKSKFPVIILSLIVIFFLTTGFGCKFMPKKKKEQLLKPVTLTYWRLFEDPDVISEIIADYQVMHPNITIDYKKMRYEEYEQMMLEALAEDRGPDIFSIHNTWVQKYKNKILPLPPQVTLPFREITGQIKKEEKISIKTIPTPTLADLARDFIPLISQDVVIDNQIYGLPLGVDTLVLFYNQDLLDQTGIPYPPVSWQEFKEQVKKLTIQDKEGNIIQAGAALGTGENISRAVDILSLLMIQNGAEMTNPEGTQVTFHQIPQVLSEGDYNPGLEAFRFYTDFALPSREVYTWNLSQPESLEAFIQGKLAFFFGYSYHTPIIKARSPKLNFKIIPVPQIEGTTKEANLANYWVETVSSKTLYPNEAWDFLRFASQGEEAGKYLTKTKKSTALRGLISSQLQDPDIEPFVKGILTVQSWYRGQDAPLAEKFILEMIDSASRGEATPEEALSLAAEKVGQTMK